MLACLVTMFDSVKFKLPRDAAPPDLEQVAELLEKPRYINVYDAKTGAAKGSKLTGMCRGVGVEVPEKEGNIFIGYHYGNSLSKFHHGDNLRDLTRETTREAVGMLEDALKMDFSRAVVARLDVAATIPVDDEPERYFSRMLAAPNGARRHAYDYGVYFRADHGEKTLKFYDKAAEYYRDHGISLNERLLRYELSLTGHLNRALGRDVITGHTLFDPEFYSDVVRYWEKNFLSITFFSYMGELRSKTPSKLMDAFVSELLTNGDNLQTLATFKERLKADGVPSLNRRRFEREIERLSGADTDPLVVELTDKVKGIAAQQAG